MQIKVTEIKFMWLGLPSCANSFHYSHIQINFRAHSASYLVSIGAALMFDSVVAS